jgi:hypothetical protein
MATEADLLRMPDDGWKYELVDGEIRRELSSEDTLDGEEVVPGFQCALRGILSDSR